MAHVPVNETLADIVITLIISLVSGFISIARRVLHGHESRILWVISEMATAILCGYLVYNGYPALQHWLPTWVTPLMAVALAAYSGGMIMHTSSQILMANFAKNQGNMQKKPDDD